MANSFSSPPALPDQTLVLPGETLRATTFDNIVETLNWSHGEGPTSPLLSQEWADDQCSWSGVSDVPNVAIWRIPKVSPAHQTLRVEFRASRSDAGGVASSVTFNCLGDTVATVPAVGAYTRYSVDLVFDNPANGYGDLSLDLSSTVGSVTLRDVTAYFAPLTSALDAGPADGEDEADAYVPMGQGVAANDQSLPAVRGRRILENVGKLVEYPRSVFCWASLRGIQAWSPAAVAPDQMPELPHRAIVRVYPRHLAQGGVYTIHARVLPDTVATTRVLIHAGGIEGFFPGGWGPPACEIEVPPADPASPIWVTGTMRIPESRFIGEIPWLTAAIGAWPGEPRADAAILSLSGWGA